MKTLLAFRNKLLAGLALALTLSSSAAHAAIDLSTWKNAAGPNTGLTPDITLSSSPLQNLVPVQVDFSICNRGDEVVTSTLFEPIQGRLRSLQADLITDGDSNDIKSLADGVSIAPGACANMSFIWIPDITQGVTEIMAEANPGLLVTETDLSNNETSRAVAFDTIPPPPVPEVSCMGFYAPFAQDLNIKKKAKGTIPVRIGLTDGNGYPMTDADLSAPPVINVAFNGTVYGDGSTDDAALESVGSSNDGNAFAFNSDSGLWEYRLSSKQFSQSGTYAVSVASGDTGEYTINTDGQCAQSFIRQY